MRKILQRTLAGLLLWLPAAVSAQDDVYPSGSGVEVISALSTDRLVFGDTLVFTRQLTNGAATGLNGLYFSGSLPPSFELVGSSVTLDGAGIPFELEGPSLNQVVNGFESYRWTIDSPGSGGSLDQSVAPGELVLLTVRLVPGDLGNFDLPIQSTAFSAGGGGFAISAPMSVAVSVTASVDDDPASTLPDSYLTALAYPNPFNGEVSIMYSGLPRRGMPVHTSIYNSLGQKVDELLVESEGNEGLISWTPAEDVGSGLYLYRIKAGDQSAVGKLMFLK